MRAHKVLEPIVQFVIIYLAARNPEGGGTDLALAVIISSSVESYPLELSEKTCNCLTLFLKIPITFNISYHKDLGTKIAFSVGYDL